MFAEGERSAANDRLRSRVRAEQLAAGCTNRQSSPFHGRRRWTDAVARSLFQDSRPPLFSFFLFFYFFFLFCLRFVFLHRLHRALEREKKEHGSSGSFRLAPSSSDIHRIAVWSCGSAGRLFSASLRVFSFPSGTLVPSSGRSDPRVSLFQPISPTLPVAFFLPLSLPLPSLFLPFFFFLLTPSCAPSQAQTRSPT